MLYRLRPVIAIIRKNSYTRSNNIAHFRNEADNGFNIG